MINKEKLLKSLEGNYSFFRKRSLKKLIELESVSPELVPVQKELVPLHFATNVYYSLYTPTMCAYFAHKSGVEAVAINDYATVAGYKELKESCDSLSLPCACGYHVECKPLFNEKKAVVYGYGVAYKDYKDLNLDLSEERYKKQKSIIKIVENVNKVISFYDISLPIKSVIKSKNNVVTEKNVAKVLAEILVNKFGKDEALLTFLKNVLKIDSCEGDLRFIKEQENSYFEEDLAKVIYTKCALLKPKDKKEDCKRFIKMNNKYGIISAYKVNIKKYDERSLQEIVTVLKDNGFNAVTFKCSDIESGDVDKIVDYFMDKGILPISLYKMGLPRQHLPINEESNQLYLNSLAVIGNAISVEYDRGDGLFGINNVINCANLKKRVEIFSKVVKGRK